MMAAMAQTRKFRLVVVEGLDISLCQNQSRPDESPSLGYRPTQSCSTWWHPLLSMNNAGESWPPERLGAVFLAVSTGIGGLKILLWLLESSSLYKTFTNKAMPESKINPELQMQTKEGETSDEKNHYLEYSWPWTYLTQQPSVSVRRVRWQSSFSCHLNFKSGRGFWCCLFVSFFCSC